MTAVERPEEYIDIDLIDPVTKIPQEVILKVEIKNLALSEKYHINYDRGVR